MHITYDRPEDGYPYRMDQPLWKIVWCMLFHRHYHYTFRLRTFENDTCCDICKTQWMV